MAYRCCTESALKSACTKYYEGKIHLKKKPYFLKCINILLCHVIKMQRLVSGFFWARIQIFKCFLEGLPVLFLHPVSEDIFAQLSVLGCILDFWNGFLLTTLQCLLSVLRLCWGMHIFFPEVLVKPFSCISQPLRSIVRTHVPALFLSEYSTGCVLPPLLALVSTENFWTPNGWETLPWQPAALNHTGWDNSAEHFTSWQSHLASPYFFKEGSNLWCSTINHHGQEISFWIP